MTTSSYTELRPTTPTTKKCPFYTTLPDIHHNPAAGREDILEARNNDRQDKEKMKQEKDSNANVRDHKKTTKQRVLPGGVHGDRGLRETGGA